MPDQQYVVDLDREMCMGSGVCVSYAPESFAIGVDAKAIVRQSVSRASSDVEVAMSACPTGAITLATRSSGSAHTGAGAAGSSGREGGDDDR